MILACAIMVWTLFKYGAAMRLSLASFSFCRQRFRPHKHLVQYACCATCLLNLTEHTTVHDTSHPTRLWS
jgi:hypothetical protein